MKKGLNIFLSLLVGVVLFGFFFYYEGVGEIFSIFSNIHPFYLGMFFLFTTLTFIPTVWRWGIILKAQGEEIPFLSLLRYTLAGYAVSYVTPSARVGGEPLRAYMLHKENNIDLKAASSSIIIEKFVELSGSILFGILGLALFFSIPGLAFSVKLFFGAAVFFGFAILLIFYYRSITGKGSFSSLFLLFRLNRIARWKNFVKVIIDVEKHLQQFFVENRKAFFWSFLTYFLYGILVIFEFKFLLLGLGFNESIRTVVLAITVAGFAGFIPIPAALGFLEAGQATLFSAIGRTGSLGFAMSIVLRIRALIFVAIGFAIVSYFGGQNLGGAKLSNKRKILLKNKSREGKGLLLRRG